MKKFRLKVYTNQGIITSKVMYSDKQILPALLELSVYFHIRTAYKSDGKTSYRLTLHINNQNKRPIYYIRPDGVKVYTLSINPSNYPMLAIFEDGSQSSIDLT